MKILFTAPRFPYPLYRADNLTVYKFVRYFAQRHELDLVALDTTGDAQDHISELAPFCQEVHAVPHPRTRSYWNCTTALARSQPLQNAYFRSARLQKLVDDLTRRRGYDLLYAHTIRAAQYIEHRLSFPRVLAMQISMTLHYRRLRENTRHWFYRPLYALEHARLRAYEPAVAARFSRVMLISEHDTREIAKHGPIENVFYNPHGVDHERFAPDPGAQKEPNALVFHGHMATMSNVDAITSFVRTDYPLIKAAVPDVKLYIVGIKPPPAVVALGRDDPSVVVTGFVERPVEYLRRAAVSVDPLRVGAGLQNKVLEAMSTGLPVVATPVANEGIRAAAGESIEIAGLGGPFAQAVIALLRDGERRARLGASARQFILDRWTWDRYLGELEAMFEEVVREFRKGR